MSVSVLMSVSVSVPISVSVSVPMSVSMSVLANRKCFTMLSRINYLLVNKNKTTRINECFWPHFFSSEILFESNQIIPRSTSKHPLTIGLLRLANN